MRLLPWFLIFGAQYFSNVCYAQSTTQDFDGTNILSPQVDTAETPGSVDIGDVAVVAAESASDIQKASSEIESNGSEDPEEVITSITDSWTKSYVLVAGAAIFVSFAGGITMGRYTIQRYVEKKSDSEFIDAMDAEKPSFAEVIVTSVKTTESGRENAESSPEVLDSIMDRIDATRFLWRQAQERKNQHVGPSYQLLGEQSGAYRC